MEKGDHKVSAVSVGKRVIVVKTGRMVLTGSAVIVVRKGKLASRDRRDFPVFKASQENVASVENRESGARPVRRAAKA